MASEAIQEEREVLESILAEDLEVTSDDTLQVRVEPEEGTTSITVLLVLKIKYTSGYPDELPEISIEVQEGGVSYSPEDDSEDAAPIEEDDADDASLHMRISRQDTQVLLKRLREAGEENIGMAMVYTLVMQLKESLTEMLVAKASVKEMEEQAEQLKVQEEELAKPKGTPVTKDSFAAWRKTFEAELRALRKRQAEDELKALPPKERKERETFDHRLTGRQIFERKRTASGANEEEEEGADEEVDYSQYDRENRQDDDDSKDERYLLADSDSD